MCCHFELNATRRQQFLSLLFRMPRIEVGYVARARSNGRSTVNVRPKRGAVQSNSCLASHFDWSH